MPTFGDKFLTNFQASKQQAQQRAMQDQVNQLRLKQINEQIRSNQAAEGDRDADRNLQSQIHDDSVDQFNRQFNATTEVRPDGTRVSPEIAARGERITAADVDGNEFLIAGKDKAELDLTRQQLENAKGYQNKLLELQERGVELKEGQMEYAQDQADRAQRRYDNFVRTATGTLRQPHPVSEAIDNAQELSTGESLFKSLVSPTANIFGLELPSIRRKEAHNLELLEGAVQETRDQQAGLLGAGLAARAESALPMSIYGSQGLAGAAGINASAQDLPGVPLQGPGLFGLGEALGTSNNEYEDLLRSLEVLRHSGIGAHMQRQQP